MGAAGPDPPEKSKKKIGFLSNTVPDPLKLTKLPSQLSMWENDVSLAGR